MKKLISTALLSLLFLQFGSAQYFGRNKPRYQKLDFQVEKTPNFEMYHYLKDSSKVQELAEWTEQWYLLHQ